MSQQQTVEGLIGWCASQVEKRDGVERPWPRLVCNWKAPAGRVRRIIVNALAAYEVPRGLPITYIVKFWQGADPDHYRGNVVDNLEWREDRATGKWTMKTSVSDRWAVASLYIPRPLRLGMPIFPVTQTIEPHEITKRATAIVRWCCQSASSVWILALHETYHAHEVFDPNVVNLSFSWMSGRRPASAKRPEEQRANGAVDAVVTRFLNVEEKQAIEALAIWYWQQMGGTVAQWRELV